MTAIIKKEEAADRILEEDFWNPFEFPALRGLQAAFPVVDISETDREVRVVANVPGIDPDKIEVRVSDDSIQLSGKIEKETEEKGRKFYRFEREYGIFGRELSLPATIDVDGVSAKTKNGVLTITLPKAGGESHKKIKVEEEQS